jgi:hypothetical protein
MIGVVGALGELGLGDWGSIFGLVGGWVQDGQLQARTLALLEKMSVRADCQPIKIFAFCMDKLTD